MPPEQGHSRQAAPREGGPVLVGLTGGIAAGKSAALGAFARLGAATISADAIVHELLSSGELTGPLADRWGEDVAPGGELDRAAVGRIVFERPEELAWLERVLHPRVAEHLAEWRRALPADTEVAVVEVPLLFESGMDEHFDTTVCVTAPQAVRERRIAERGVGGDAERSGRQLSQDEKAARADRVIENDGSLEELEARIADVVAELRETERARGG